MTRLSLFARRPIALLLMVLLTSACGRKDAANDSDSAIDNGMTLYHGGAIITMEAAPPQAEAVVTGAEGRILFVGDWADALKAYPGARAFDLKGRTLMPGFIEQHLHPFLGALTLSLPVIAPEPWELPERSWPAAADHAAYMKALRTVEAEMQSDDEILWTWGFNQFFHGELNRALLDQISSTRPIAVWHRSAHEFTVNTPFIERFGITQAAVDRAGPQVAEQVDLARGHFYEAGAMLYLLPIIFPELGSPAHFRSGLEQMVVMLHRRGVTAFNEPGALIPESAVPIYLDVLGDAGTPLYSFFIPESKTPYFAHGAAGVQAAVEQTVNTFGDNQKVRFLPGQVKLLFDGAIISQLMQMKAPYLDGHQGEWIQTPEEVDEISTIFWRAGYQLHVHVNGDLGLEKLIAILRKRQQEYPRVDHRFTVVHMASSSDEQLAELAELGAIVSVNPYYLTGFGERFGELGLGPERAHAMARLATAEKAGLPISLHSDLPMAPADPLYLAWSAATRESLSGEVLRPDLALSRDAALRAITIEAAYSWRMEDHLGSLKPGKIANFTILDQNPYQVPLDQLKAIPVYATVFEGRLFPIEP